MLDARGATAFWHAPGLSRGTMNSMTTRCQPSVSRHGSWTSPIPGPPARAEIVIAARRANGLPFASAWMKEAA